MHPLHPYLATVPFDLYELHLFELVARHRSFSKAAGSAGLTQSAVSRQIQAMEEKLGVPLFDRTTRQVDLTPAGRFLAERSVKLLGELDLCLTTLREEYANAPKQLRVGVSTTVSLAYLPGFFVAHRRAHPDVQLTVSHERSDSILQKLEAGEFDAGVICAPNRLPKNLQVTHTIEDAFTLIFPRSCSPAPSADARAQEWKAWVNAQSWLQIGHRTNTGIRLREWLDAQCWNPAAVSFSDNFDLIVNLVAMGLGVALVPVRALAIYGRKRSIVRASIPHRFTRQLVIITTKASRLPRHVSDFLESVLF